MVLYSNEIKDFLDKIYFHELTHRNDIDFPLYYYYKDKLRQIDSINKHVQSTTFPLSRDGLFGLVIGRLEFGYTFDGKNACIEYYINHEPRNDWFDWLIREGKHTYKHIITESQLRSIIRETIKKLLRA